MTSYKVKMRWNNGNLDEDPSVISNEQRIQYQLNHHKIDLITDNGVFSKDKVDYGSDVLVQTFLKAHPPGPSH